MKKKKTIVVGHKNPDTDSVCAAVAYAALKSQTTKGEYEACMAGKLSNETKFVLEKFGIKTPRLCMDVSPDISDVEINPIAGQGPNTSLYRAWVLMRTMKNNSQPVVDEDGKLLGLCSLGDLAKANMDTMDPFAISKACTPKQNVVDVLEGTVLAGSSLGNFESGKIIVGASRQEAITEAMAEGDIVLVGDRADAQEIAIEDGAACLIICMGKAVEDRIIKMAADAGCLLIHTNYDTYAASNIIRLSMPIGAFMTEVSKLTMFLPNEPLEEVKKVMGEIRHSAFPIVNANGEYMGMIGRRDIMLYQKKQLILVDHNEPTQCVDGIGYADILEIIDHHRLGGLETTGPLFFRNQPVGCTSTIITQMYKENAVEIKPEIAGIMLCAILSDTLVFSSPTCTELDKEIAKELAQIAGYDINEIARQMFEAGEDLTGKTAEDVCYQDFKIFVHDDVKFGVGQGSYMSERNRLAAIDILTPYLDKALKKDDLNMVFFMCTDIATSTTTMLSAGEGAFDLVCKAFRPTETNGTMATLENVVSRKKQVIPSLLNALS